MTKMRVEKAREEVLSLLKKKTRKVKLMRLVKEKETVNKKRKKKEK